MADPATPQPDADVDIKDTSPDIKASTVSAGSNNGTPAENTDVKIKSGAGQNIETKQTEPGKTQIKIEIPVKTPLKEGLMTRLGKAGRGTMAALAASQLLNTATPNFQPPTRPTTTTESEDEEEDEGEEDGEEEEEDGAGEETEFEPPQIAPESAKPTPPQPEKPVPGQDNQQELPGGSPEEGKDINPRDYTTPKAIAHAPENKEIETPQTTPTGEPSTAENTPPEMPTPTEGEEGAPTEPPQVGPEGVQSPANDTKKTDDDLAKTPPVPEVDKPVEAGIPTEDSKQNLQTQPENTQEEMTPEEKKQTEPSPYGTPGGSPSEPGQEQPDSKSQKPTDKNEKSEKDAGDEKPKDSAQSIAAELSQQKQAGSAGAKAEEALTTAGAGAVKAAEAIPYVGPVIKIIAIVTKLLKTILGQKLAEIFICWLLFTILFTLLADLLLPGIGQLLTFFIMVAMMFIAPTLYYTDVEIPILSNLLGSALPANFKPTLKNFLRFITESVEKAAAPSKGGSTK